MACRRRLGAGAPATETRKNADTTALAANNIPITRLDGDWTMPEQGGLLALMINLFG
ncbi:MAG: hypothetical protein NTX33_11350 [Propionibacteriales bacterium]|nr:hypothetical protein [Propionibacteriales bacterium]